MAVETIDRKAPTRRDLLQPAGAALGYWLAAYRRTWRSSVLSSFVMPLLFLTGIGLGVGGYVDSTAGTSGSDGFAGIGYLAYLAPGLLAMTALQTGFGECTWMLYASIKWNKQYVAMLATPIRPVDAVAGHLAYVLVRLTVVAVAFFAVMAAFGTLHSLWSPLALLAAVLTGLATATPTYAFTASVGTEMWFSVLHRFVMLPMTLFSGVFFPVEQLPALLRPVAYASPLWHGVELCRAATLGGASPWPAPVHLAYLLIWLTAGLVLAPWALRRRLLV